MMGSELDLLGQWPFPREELEKMKEGVYIPREKILRFIHGKKNNTRIDFYVSNDLFHVGKMVIPAKGSSDIEVHNGDEVIYVLKDTSEVLTIIAPSLWSTEERGTEIAYTKKPVRFMGRLQA